jgi:hypothetical protein
MASSSDVACLNINRSSVTPEISLIAREWHDSILVIVACSQNIAVLSPLSALILRHVWMQELILSLVDNETNVDI